MFENSNRRSFQKGLDCNAARTSRRDARLTLRRKEREQHLKKKIKLCANRSQSNGENDEPFAKIDLLPKYIASVMLPGNATLNLSGLQSIRRLLSIQRDPPIVAVLRSGVIPKVIRFLYGDDSIKDEEIRNECKFEAAWILTNIAAGNAECVAHIVQHGAIEGLVDLLRSASEARIASQAIWGLGNIAGEATHYKDRILQSGVLSDIMEILDDAANLNSEIQTQAIWCMSNIFRYANNLKLSDVEGIYPIVAKLLRESKRDQILADCLWALYYLTSQNEHIIGYVCDNGLVNICMKLLNQEVAKYQVALNQNKMKANVYDLAGKTQSETDTKNNTKDAILKMNMHIYRPCFRIIGSVLSEEDRLAQIVLDEGYLDVIEPFLFHWIPTQRKEILWSLSNILAGNHQQIEYVLSRPKIVEAIIAAANNDLVGVRREACWCICNATQDGITEQRKRLAEFGAIEALCKMLAPSNKLSDTHLQCIVEGLEGFLSVFGERGNYNPFAEEIEEFRGLDYLEERTLDQTISEENWNSMLSLIHKYWGTDEQSYGVDDEVKENLAADIDTKTNRFKFGVNTTNENNPNVMNTVFSF